MFIHTNGTQVGYFGVRWFAIDKATGGVDAAAGRFVLWSVRVGAFLGPLFYGSGRDPQLRLVSHPPYPHPIPNPNLR